MQTIILIGDSEPHLGQSLWLELCQGRRVGEPPTVDLAAERRAGECVRRLIHEGHLTAVHDCSDGGVAVAIAEMALAGGIGAAIDDELPLVWNSKVTAFLFGEQQGRYVCTVASEEIAKQLRPIVEGQGLRFAILGRTGDHRTRNLEFGGYRPGDSGYIGAVALADLRAAHDGFFPRLMGSELTPEF